VLVHVTFVIADPLLEAVVHVPVVHVEVTEIHSILCAVAELFVVNPTRFGAGITPGIPAQRTDAFKLIVFPVPRIESPLALAKALLEVPDQVEEPEKVM